MAEYTVKVEGVLETANGKSRVSPGRVVELTEQDHAHNAHLFVVPEPPVAPKAESEVEAEVQPHRKPEPVRHTPKAEPAKATQKPAAKTSTTWKPTGHKR
jgi:septal ring-binding cell division protein DamX